MHRFNGSQIREQQTFPSMGESIIWILRAIFVFAMSDEINLLDNCCKMANFLTIPDIQYIVCLILFMETALLTIIVIDENDKKPQNITKMYHVVNAGESLFLDELENCKSNQWFKIGKTKPLRTKRVFANSSSSGVYYCREDGPTNRPILHHHLLVIETAPEIRINNPPLIDGEMSNVSCNCSASLKSYNFIITMNLIFGNFYIYSETIDSYKFKTTVMALTSSQRINKIQPFMNGSITCLWLVGERSTVEVKWWELARVSLQAQIMVPATTAYPDLTTTTPERKVTCSAHAIPPIFKCNWKSHLRTVNFITDETGCVLRIFNTGVHLFTCMAFNLIGGKMYTASWSGELTVLSEENYVANDLEKEASMEGLLKRIVDIKMASGAIKNGIPIFTSLLAMFSACYFVKV